MAAEDQKKENGTADVSMTDANAPKPDPKKDLLKNGKKPDDADDELSEEDRALKENLELLVTRAVDKDVGVQKLALETIRSEIRSATSSMTSVPKPLKFLRDHFLPLKQHYAKMGDDAALKDNKQFLADILSVLAMTMGDDESCESLRYKLLGSDEAPHLWGHEYVRHLAGEIGREFNELLALSDSMSDDPPDTAPPKITGLNADGTVKLPRATDKSLLEIIDDIVPFLITSNAEPEAVDLLIEVDALHKLPALADKHNYSRVCLYLKACADYTKESDALLSVAIDIYVKVDKLPEAMQVALRRGHLDQITRLYKMSRPQSAERMQLAFDLASANILVDEDVEGDDTYREVMSNRKRTEHFKHLAKDLDVLEPKVPEDIYKSHLIDSRAAAPSGDSARANLASTYVNAFVNMGFGKDKLMADTETSWIYRNKEHGMMAAAASLGMIGLWDDDSGLGELDKYLYSDQEHVKAGALLGIGLLFAGIRNDVEPAMALLVEQLTAEKSSVRNGAVAGLAIAYTGTCKEEVKDALIPILLDQDASPDTVALAALALGLVYVGSADEELCSSMIENLAERKNSPAINSEPMLAIFLPLGLGLLFLGKQEAIEATEETLPALVGSDSLLGRIALITLTACAYCGTGDIEQVQNFLTICSEHPSVSEDVENAPEAMQTPPAETADASPAEGAGATNAATPAPAAATNGDGETASSADVASEQERVRIATAEQSVAVLGLAMVSMGEELGADMSVRTFGHLLQYGDSQIRRMVPLALALLSVSNPKLSLMDLLSKFTHDQDMDVAQASILGLGLIGAGTNNSRIAGILRQLSSYYSKEPSSLFLVRISQGLLHSAKGLVTLNPHYGDSKFVLSNCAMGGLITVLFSCLDMKATITGKNHFLIYFLALAARPRMVFTVNKELEFVKTSVRVGNAVDTVGQAGRPKSITGFQTHTTPVLIGGGERAELATEQYIKLASAVEGVVVVEENPEWEDESGLEAAAAAMDTTGEGDTKKEDEKVEIVD